MIETKHLEIKRTEALCRAKRLHAQSKKVDNHHAEGTFIIASELAETNALLVALILEIRRATKEGYY